MNSMIHLRANACMFGPTTFGTTVLFHDRLKIDRGSHSSVLHFSTSFN